MTDIWTDRLSEYLDGDLGADDRRALEAHLGGCAECARTLEELRGVVRQLGALGDAAPPPAVWAAVERSVAAPRAPEVVPIAAVRAPRRLSFSLPQLIAAGLTLALLSGGAGYVLRHRSAAPEQAPVMAQGVERQADSPAAAAPVVAVAMPWEQYDAAVADLERVLADGRGRLRPETVQAIERSVAAIDGAIEQARQALAKDPANEYLNRHLADNMKRKLELLRNAAQIVGRQS